jgi:hypothetical protein
MVVDKVAETDNDPGFSHRAIAGDGIEDSFGLEVLHRDIGGHARHPADLQVDALPHVTARPDPVIAFALESERLEQLVERLGVGRPAQMQVLQIAVDRSGSVAGRLA